MSKLTKRIGIGATITTILSAALMAIFTPDVLLWIGIILGIGIGASVMSWAYTQVRKMLKFPNKALWREDANRVWIMRRAVRSGFAFNLTGGVVFAFFQNPLDTWQQVTAVAVLWVMYSLLIGLTSPFTWSWTFEHLLPALNRYVDGHGVRVDRGADGKITGFKDGNDDTVFVGKGAKHEMVEEDSDMGGERLGPRRPCVVDPAADPDGERQG